MPEEGLPFRARTLGAGHWAAWTAIVAAGILALTGLAGWVCDSEALKSVLPGQSSSMKPNTAVALLLVAGALLLRLSWSASPRAANTARAGAAAAVGIGAITLFEYASGVELGVDQLLFRDTSQSAHTMPAGRMAPNTALALVLAGLTALVARSPRQRAWAGQALALAVVLLGMLRLYGFAFGVPYLGAPPEYTSMALHTALALVLLGGGAFLVRPQEDLAGLLMNSGTTGVLGRRMVATVVIVPPGLGLLRLAGQDAGWYGTRMGVALLVCGHVLVFLVLTFVALRTGRRTEIAHARAESQVRRHQWLQALMDHSPAMIFVKDRQGRYLSVNTGFEQRTGKPREQVLGRRADEVLPAAVAREVWADQERVLADGVARQREDSLRSDGSERTYLTTLFALPDHDGQPFAVCGVATDVTEQVTARQETERAHRLFSTLLESAPEATLITDRHGTIVMVNDQAQQLFGRPNHTLVGTYLTQLAPADRRWRQAALLRAYLRRQPKGPERFDADLWGSAVTEAPSLPRRVSAPCRRMTRCWWSSPSATSPTGDGPRPSARPSTNSSATSPTLLQHELDG
ncbi:PAS domain-containing protein [Streptomyces sp. L7]